MKKKLVIMESKVVFTPEEMNYLDKFNWNATLLEPIEQRKILEIYNKFGYNQPMTQCTPCWAGILNNLRGIYNQYK